MRLLLYSWNANNEAVLADNLIKFGFEIIWFRKECRNYTRDMKLAMEMIQYIHAEAVEAVISFNYFPIISMICNTCQIPYYSWVFDCPHFTLYAKQMMYECNHIGVFDKEMVRNLREYGVKTAYHVPLSVDVGYFQKIISSAERKEKEKYQCDISFVGSLYADEHNYYDFLSAPSAESITDKINEVILQQCFSYCHDYIEEAVAENRIDMAALQSKMERHGLALGEDYFAKTEDVLKAAVLEKKVTVEERRILLTNVIEHFGNYGNRSNKKLLDCRIYTASSTKIQPELDSCNYGRVDYCTQMPLVFDGSKINLNISLRSIHSGIPLRVLDVMACGGFVLTNWQPELAEYFVEDVEIAIFRSLDECIEKISYYLAHEKERRQMAAAGQKKVKEKFSYRTGIARLFEV